MWHLNQGDVNTWTGITCETGQEASRTSMMNQTHTDMKLRVWHNIHSSAVDYRTWSFVIDISDRQ
jgi:hypothetical protein